MRILVIAKNSDRFRELNRRGDLMRHDFVFASSPRAVGKLTGKFDAVLDYKDSFENKRYMVIKECVEAYCIGHGTVWYLDVEDLP